MFCVNRINSVVSKIYVTLRNLRMSAPSTPVEVRSLLASQLTRVPTISYSETIFGNIDASSLHKLYVAFNNASIRIRSGFRRYDHICSYQDGCT